MLNLVRRTAGPLVLSHLLGALQKQGAMPVPQDEPRVRVEGPETQRILLLGGIVAGSWGVTSHALGMAGHLARMVHAITRRGVDIEVHSVLPGSVSQMTGELDGIRLSGFDAIVTLLGGVETRSLWSSRRWTRELRALLDRLALLAPDVPIVVVGVTHLPSELDVGPSIIRLVDRTTDELNSATRGLVAEFPDARFLIPRTPLPASGAELLPSYADGANAITPVLSRALVEHSRHRGLDAIGEQRRLSALDLLGILDSGFDHRYDRVAENARELLRASGAAITFIDRDRQYIKASSGLPSEDTSRWIAFCDTTIRGSAGFVVEDADEASGFGGHPWVVGAQKVRSYAGFPLAAPDGEAVGALCVVDTVPRHFTELDLSLLRHLAGRLQLLLWSDGDPATRR